MKTARFSVALAALLLVAGYIVYSSRGEALQRSQTPCCSEPRETGPREIDFPYYSLRDGFNSTLLLVSDSPKPMDLTVVVRNLTGQTLFAPMSIQPQEKLAIDVRGLLAGQSD